jgi:hypothetical protein
VVLTRSASAASAAKSETCGRLYLYDALLEGLAQHLQDVAAARRPFIQKENPMVRLRPLARQGDLAPPISPPSAMG